MEKSASSITLSPDNAVEIKINKAENSDKLEIQFLGIIGGYSINHSLASTSSWPFSLVVKL